MDLPRSGEAGTDRAHLAGNQILSGAGGNSTGGLTGPGGGLGDVLVQGDLMSSTETRRPDGATPAVGTAAALAGTGGARARESERQDGAEGADGSRE